MMKTPQGRTRNFSKRVEIERRVLASANSMSAKLSCPKLLGLSGSAIDNWIVGLSSQIEQGQVSEIETAVRELARGTGLLADESRCAVAEGKVSADFPELMQTCDDAFKTATQS